MSAAAVGAGRVRGDSKVDINEDEMRYQRICKAIGGTPTSNTKHLTQQQRIQAYQLVQAELGAMERSGLVNMGVRKRTLEADLATRFHADDAHFMVTGELRVEEGNVQRNLALRGIVACNGYVVRLADSITSVMRAVWQSTRPALPSHLHLPAEEVTEKVDRSLSLSPSLPAAADRPFVPQLALDIETEKDTKDDEYEQIGNRGRTPIDRNLPSPFKGQITPISMAFQRTPTAQHGNHSRNVSSVPFASPAQPPLVQSPRPPRPPSRRNRKYHQSMAELGTKADGTSRAVARVGSKTAVGAQVLSYCARVQKSSCFRFARGLWNLVPEQARNYIVRDYIKDPLKEGVRDATRVAVIYGVYTLFRMVIG